MSLKHEGGRWRGLVRRLHPLRARHVQNGHRHRHMRLLPRRIVLACRVNTNLDTPKPAPWTPHPNPQNPKPQTTLHPTQNPKPQTTHHPKHPNTLHPTPKGRRCWQTARASLASTARMVPCVCVCVCARESDRERDRESVRDGADSSRLPGRRR